MKQMNRKTQPLQNTLFLKKENKKEKQESIALFVKDLTLAYGDFVLMKKISFTVKEKEIFIIMGASGSGKSTLLKALIGLKRPQEGSVCIEGTDFWRSDTKTQKDIMKKSGVLYQSGALFSSMTLAENIALPLQQSSAFSLAEIDELVHLKLALVGLEGFEDFYPSEISGGMKKRAGLARALALDPKIVYFDEPSAGLDPVSSRLLDDLIIQINQNLGTTIVIVTHELESIFAIGTNSIFLDEETKTIIAKGNPKDLLRHPPNEKTRHFLTRTVNENEKNSK
jgi:phospholipid/cholesterol/gamma-HCH transport system ATP-binding protein